MKKLISIVIAIMIWSIQSWAQCSNPNTGIDTEVCGFIVNLSVINATTGSWAAYSDGVPVLVTFLPDNSATEVEASVEEFTDPLLQLDFVWTDFSGPCTDTVMVSFYRRPEAFAGLDGAACGNEFTLGAEFSIPETENYSPSGVWSLCSWPVGENCDINSIYTSESQITVSDVGIWSYKWRENNSLLSTCYDLDTVVVEFVEIPVVDAGQDFDVCGNCVELGGYFGGYWTSDCTEIEDYDEIVCVGSYGVCTFVAHLENQAIHSFLTCEGTDSMDITFWRKPTANILIEESDTIVCGLQFNNLIAEDPGSGVVGYWYNSNPATLYGDDLSNSTWVKVPNDGYYNFYWHEDGGPLLMPGFCADTAGPLRIHFLNTEPLFAGNDFSIVGYAGPLNAISEIDSPYSDCTYQWENENAIFQDSSSLQTLAFVSAYGQYDFILTSSYVNMNTCTDSDIVRITFLHSSQQGIDSEDNTSLEIFPNPASEYISISSDRIINSAQIFDINGKLIKLVSDTFENIDISGLEQGMYFVLIYIDDEVLKGKFVR